MRRSYGVEITNVLKAAVYAAEPAVAETIGRKISLISLPTFQY